MTRALKPQVVDKVINHKTNEYIEIMLDRNHLEFFAEFEGDSFRHKEAAPVKAWAEKTIKDGIKIKWTPVLVVEAHNQDANDSFTDHQKEDTSRAIVSYTISRKCLGMTRSGIMMESDFTVFRPGPAPYLLGGEIKRSDPPQLTDDEIRSQHMHVFSTGRLDFQGKKLFLPVEDGEIQLPYKVRQPIRYRGQGEEKYDERQFVLYLPYSQPLWDELSELIDLTNKLGARINDLLSSNDGENFLAWVMASMAAALPSGEEHDRE